MDFILHVEEYNFGRAWCELKEQKFTNKIVLQIVGGGAQFLQLGTAHL